MSDSQTCGSTVRVSVINGPPTTSEEPRVPGGSPPVQARGIFRGTAPSHAGSVTVGAHRLRKGSRSQAVDVAAPGARAACRGDRRSGAMHPERDAASGGRLFIRVGATGRLALTVESLWRRRHPDDDGWWRSWLAGRRPRPLAERSRTRARTGPDMTELGFWMGIYSSCTEGGETPTCSVPRRRPGALLRIPWLLFQSQIGPRPAHQRFRQVKRLAFGRCTRGPDGPPGRTRMKASTVLQLAPALRCSARTIARQTLPLPRARGAAEPRVPPAVHRTRVRPLRRGDHALSVRTMESLCSPTRPSGRRRSAWPSSSS